MTIKIIIIYNLSIEEYFKDDPEIINSIYFRCEKIKMEDFNDVEWIKEVLKNDNFFVETKKMIL